MKKLIAGLMLAVMVLFAPLAGASSAQAQTPYVTVHRGDTLGGIAYAHHTTWQRLAAINHLRNPNAIYPGERIYLVGSAPVTVTKPVKGSPAPAPAGSRIIATGAEYRGVPYVWGGTTPRGFDCSGFTKYVFGKLGTSIPRTAEDQYRSSHHTSQPVAGDLVFVHDGGGNVYHVAIYVNAHTWLEAEEPGRGVNYYSPWSRSVYYGSYAVK